MEQLLHLLLHCPGCLQSCSFHMFPLCSSLNSIPSAQELSLLESVIPEVSLPSLFGTPLAVVCLSWSQLVLVLLDMGKLLPTSRRNHPCSAPVTKTWPHKPNTGTNERTLEAPCFYFGNYWSGHPSCHRSHLACPICPAGQKEKSEEKSRR